MYFVFKFWFFHISYQNRLKWTFWWLLISFLFIKVDIFLKMRSSTLFFITKKVLLHIFYIVYFLAHFIWCHISFLLYCICFYTHSLSKQGSGTGWNNKIYNLLNNPVISVLMYKLIKQRKKLFWLKSLKENQFKPHLKSSQAISCSLAWLN